ncbi:MAG: flippase, partial [Deltaproteobacteria bacterium]|nr:flippase [Deltaproteobacteria bacterium]
MPDALPKGTTAGRVARNTLWLSAARVGSKLLALPLVILLARKLEPEGFGQWALIMSLVIILSTLADGGFQTVTIRDLAARPGRARPYFLKTLSARLVLSGLAGLGLIVWGLTAEVGQAPLWLLGLGAVLLFPEALIKAGQAVLNARERMDLTSSLSLLQAAGTTLLVGGAVLLGWGLGGAFSALAVVNLAAAGGLVLMARPYLLSDEPEEKSPWRLFTTAFPYGLLALLTILYFRVDIIMLAGFKGPEAAGQYNAALRLFDAGLILPVALSGALFPVMSRQMAAGEMSGLLASYSQAVRLLMIVALPAAAAGWFFSGWVVRLFFGPAYAQAGPVLVILALSWVLFFINAPVGNILAASNLMPKFVPWAAANTALNVVLNLWLIPLYSAVGAALATLVCELTGLIIQLFFARRVFPFWPPLAGLVLRPALPGAVLFLFWLLPPIRTLSPWL